MMYYLFHLTRTTPGTRTRFTFLSSSNYAISFQGDQFRRLHPERSILDSPCQYGIYSLKLKHMLLDNLTIKQNKNKEAQEKEERELLGLVARSTGGTTRSFIKVQ